MRLLHPVHRWLLALFGFLIVLVVGVVFHLNANPADTIPPQTLPAPNAFDYDVKAGNALVDSDKVQEALALRRYGSSRPLPSYTLTQKEALVRENAPALKWVRSGFAFAYFSPQSAEYDPFLMLFSRKCRSLAQVLRLEGQTRVARGDWGGAAASDLDALQLGEGIPHGGALTGAETGTYCQDQGRIPLWALVPHLSAKQAKSAARRLEAIQAGQTPYADTMQQEEWSGQAGLLKIFHARNWRKEMTDGVFASLVDNDAARNLRLLYQAKVLFTSKQAMYADYTRYMDQQVGIARSSYAAKIPVRPLPLDPLHGFLFSSFGFDYGTMRFPEARCEADNALLTVLLALRAYQVDHGAPPNTLQSLVPAYLHKVPEDPFALSGPLRYRHSGQHFVVYSVGPDGKDDHGVPVLDPTQPPPSKPGAFDRRYWVTDGSKGDIVAGINVD